VWANYAGEYQAPQGSIQVSREGDRLLGAGGGMTMEFVPLSSTEFVMLSDVSTLDEQTVQFDRRGDGSVVLLFFGQPFAVKR
jgi:hypothetical protein